jgi:antitoxin component of RelBE/YafQ-DinJ toxin-antitoxin module
MSQVPLTIKIDLDIKQQAQKLAKSLGLSLSTIIENQLKEVIRVRRVVFEDLPLPNTKTLNEVRSLISKPTFEDPLTEKERIIGKQLVKKYNVRSQP